MKTKINYSGKFIPFRTIDDLERNSRTVKENIYEIFLKNPKSIISYRELKRIMEYNPATYLETLSDSGKIKRVGWGKYILNKK